MATALMKHNHKVSIYDTNVSRDPFSELRKLVPELEPEVFGVTLRNIDNCMCGNSRSYVKSFLDLVSMLKEAMPSSKIIAGGPGFSIYPRQLMERAKEVDYGVFLEGEESVPELLNNLDHPQSVRGIFYRHKDTLHFTGASAPVDFASQPAPRRDVVDLTPYLERSFSIGVQTKRGCAFKCAYCTYPYLEGAELRLRPAHAVVDELEELVKEYGLQTFWFADSIFNVPQSHARSICQEMLARGLSLRWRSFQNEKFVDEEYMKLARDAGCDTFRFSPDGVSKSTLTALKKNLTEEDIERVYSLAKQVDDVRVSFYFFINGPGENLGNLFRLLSFVVRSKFRLRRKLDFVSFFGRIRIYPHTPIHALALEKGLVKEGDDLLRPVFYNPPPLRYILAVLTPFMRIVVARGRAVSVFKRLVPGFRKRNRHAYGAGNSL
jgi:putative variant cofactor biosynthesis B12-binding/radical SAM domain protein 1